MLNHPLSSEMVIHSRSKKDDDDDDDHSSLFETSHVLGSLMASSPLLMQSWSLCERANACNGSGFAVEEHDGVVYVAFSGTVLQYCTAAAATQIDAGFFGLMPIEGSWGNELFAPLAGGDGDDDDDNSNGDGRAPPVLVQAGALHLFLNLYQSPEFQMLKSATKGKSVIFTGHSIGGSLASIAALHFLCYSSSSYSSSRPAVPAPPSSLLCITFGALLLGNEGLSRAVLRERWTGNFCHVVSQLDIVPRLLFCPLHHSSPQLAALLSFLRPPPPSISSSSSSSSSQFTSEHKGELFRSIAMHLNAAAAAATTAAAEQKLSFSSQQATTTTTMNVSPYRPFGNYVLCSRAATGAVCTDDALVVVKMLYLTFAAAAAARPEAGLSVEAEHYCYGDVVMKALQNLLVKKRSDNGGKEGQSCSNYSVGVSLALEASGIPVQDMAATEALKCLEMPKRICRHPNLRCASLSVRLAKVTPCRAQIEWYKALCDGEAGSAAMGYYDCFKLRRSPKREAKVNMNRIKLAKFWNDLISMLQSNELPHDFHHRNKWVNAAHFYKLLVEPLDIAEYYRQRWHERKGHYLSHGRARRYEVFDRWWSEYGEKEEEEDDDVEEEDPCSQGGRRRKRRRRSKFAGLTQDSCFWARVEEAIDWLEKAEASAAVMEEEMAELWKKLRGFEVYAKGLIERKEVSKDVLAPRSIYSVWAERWKELQGRPPT